MINLIHLLEGQYDYGCVMAYIDEDATRKILDFNYSSISEELIYKEGDEYGREKIPHVTIKYGLTNSYSHDDMRKLLHDVSPFNVKIKGINIFENEKFDVVKFDVDSPELRKLNERFSKLPNHDRYPEYSPHMTLAYCKKGVGKNFVKESGKIAFVPVKTIVYSDKGEKSYYNL